MLRLDRPLVLTQIGFLVAGLLSLANATDTAYLWFDMWRFVDGKADEHWDPATLGPMPQ